jgi:predicted alpha-1,6-mannanase (GH76 family)
MDNWYQPASGSWQGLGWWKSANALETVIDYSFQRSLQNVDQIIAQVYENRKDGDFINDYYDDEAWWALAWVKGYDRTKDSRYLLAAESIFTDILSGWDESVCSGGLWWSKARKEKNAIENELFITLGARLYLRTGKPTYLNWTQRAWQWFDQTGMQGPDGLINDGIDLNTCTNNGNPTWTYNQGVILGGLTDLYTITHDSSYLDKAERIASAAMNTLVNSDGILVEPCESSSGGCGNDGTQFKGIFVRYLSYLHQSVRQLVAETPGVFSNNLKQHSEFLSLTSTFLTTQANSIWNNDREEGTNKLGLHWGGPYVDASPSTQSSALDALVAAISL